MANSLKKNILLVEDESILALAEKMSLVNRGYVVVIASSGEEAVEIVEGGADIDLVLMDIDLGAGINGPEAATRILRRRDLPVVFLSGHVEPEVVALTETITSYGYVVKNSGITVLDASIKMAFKLHQANRLLNLEKEHLSTTLHSIGDAVIVTDVNGQVTRMNPVAEALTGWPQDEALGQPVNSVFPIFDAKTGEPVENPALRTMATGAVVGLANHTVLVSRTGQRFQIADSGAPIAAPDGTISGAVLVFRDVTDAYQQQQALRESEYFFKESQRVAHIGSYKANFVANRWESSEVLDDILGIDFSYERSISSWLAIVHPHDRESLARYLADEVQTGKSSFNKEYRIRRVGDGQTRWVHGLGVVTFDAPGQPISMIGTIQDITDRKLLQMALEKRMIAMTRPLDHPEGIAFEDLFEPEVLQRLQDEFSTATGVASIITQPDGTPITRPSNFTRLCHGIIRCSEVGRANCFRSDAALGRYHPDGPTVQVCLSGGLWDAGASITVGERHMANWLIGQVRDETQSEQIIRAYARTLGVDEDQAAQAFLEVPVMSNQKFRQVAQALYTLANELSKTAWQNVQQSRFISETKRVKEPPIHR